MEIRKAEAADIGEVAALYDALIDNMNELHTNYPAWAKGYYPTRKTAEDALAEGALYVGIEGGAVAAACVLNHSQAPQYKKAKWAADAPDAEVLTIHTFCVHPDHHRKGFAKQLLAFAEEEGRAQGCAGIRLDTAVQNELGIHMYENAGYRVAGVVDLETGRPGLTFHRLYEKVLHKGV